MESLSLERLVSQWHQFSNYATDKFDISYEPISSNLCALTTSKLLPLDC
jgi:hypothetical protein